MVAEQNIAGTMRSDGTTTAFEISGHTRFSLQVRLPETLQHGGSFLAEKFIIEIDETEIELGRCRLLRQTKADADECTVIPLDDIVDVVDLFDKKRLTVSDTGLFNLQLILNQKDKVSREFKEYSANLTFELNVYKQFFDDLDLQYLSEPESVRLHLQQMIIDREGQSFKEFVELKVQELEDRTHKFSKDENEAHGFFFRKQVWHFILHSAFMIRTNLKPRGYAGDFEMMKMIYENEIIGKTIFARLFHGYSLQRPAAEAVRNRRVLIAGYLREAIQNHGDHTEFRALSVACGPAAELNEALRDLKQGKRIHLTLLDQDSEAIAAATTTVELLEREKGWPIKATYINDSVRSMLRIRNLAKEWGKYDFIYSMGLFDYLTPPVARAVLDRLYKMLMPGGRLIVGNFHSKNPDRAFMEYWLDWVLYHRTRDEMLALADNLPGESRVFFEETGCQMFLEVTAPKLTGS